ncbi:hypothetical protein PRZ48_011448 [Zasmidium cellare]|uniref:DUF7730 domain-containing protein n=1 Tax=Zasmidium cellare TaxID=395010 RepID=A0ABR0E6D5_ZASCE|nr:hypothetical protein PRZ48_011448 [Zasmidium cellare]
MAEEPFHEVGLLPSNSWESDRHDDLEDSDEEEFYYDSAIRRNPSFRGPYGARQMYRRSSSSTKISMDCDPQSQAPLFRLPPELRTVIYEYVFGSGTIHVTTRNCTFMDTHLTSSFSPQIIGDWNGPDGETFVKSTYSVCEDPLYWKQAYAGSKLGKFDHRREAKHMSQCPRAADDFQNEALATILLQTAMRPKSEGDWRQFKADHNARLTALKQQHAQSALDLNLLQTCRLIYHEAWKLPFVNYAFDIPEPGSFALKVLFEHQAATIQTLRFDTLPRIGKLAYVCGKFSGLKRLQITLPPGPSFHALDSQFRIYFSLTKVESVQAILPDGVSSGHEAKRAEAERMEQFLVKTEKRGRGRFGKKKISERLRWGIDQGLCVIDGFQAEDPAGDDDGEEEEDDEDDEAVEEIDTPGTLQTTATPFSEP